MSAKKTKTKARTGPGKTHDLVFLFDVDNTLLDNDRMQNDLFRHIEREFGTKARARYLDIFEQLRDQLGYADYLGALERYRIENMHDPRLLHMANWLVEYPFRRSPVSPHALDVIKRVKRWGTSRRSCPTGTQFSSRAKWNVPDCGRRLAGTCSSSSIKSKS